MSLKKISVEHVTKSIKGTRVIRNVTMELEKGRIYGLRGPNGSGKTMMLRLLSGLIRPTEGRIIFDGLELGKDLSYPPSIGILIENPAFLPSYTGYQNLKMIADIKKKDGDREICEILEKVGLEAKNMKKYKKYSLGMKQRLGIAAALLENPDLILLDEPFNALDEEGIKQIDSLIRQQRERGAIVVLACHDAGHLVSLADQVINMKEGCIGEITED